MAHKVSRSLVSVSDKTGLTDLCRLLTETYKVRSSGDLTSLTFRLKFCRPAAPRKLCVMQALQVRAREPLRVPLRVASPNSRIVREVSDYTGFPEMLDGRVKTLHPLVHGGTRRAASV